VPSTPGRGDLGERIAAEAAEAKEGAGRVRKSKSGPAEFYEALGPRFTAPQAFMATGFSGPLFRPQREAAAIWVLTGCAMGRERELVVRGSVASVCVPLGFCG
jgi:hypothetical protein